MVDALSLDVRTMGLHGTLMENAHPAVGLPHLEARSEEMVLPQVKLVRGPDSYSLTLTRS